MKIKSNYFLLPVLLALRFRQNRVPLLGSRFKGVNRAARIPILQKLAGTNWGATPQSLRTIYVSFIRPVLEYANPVLNLASRTSLEKLDRVQNAALRLVLGAPRSTPIAILELAAVCEPLGLRRGEQTVFAQERYLRTGEGASLKAMVEDFATQHRRIKKVSVLSVAHDLSKKYCVPTDRAPLPVPSWAPETAPTPLKTACTSDRWEEKTKRTPSL
ncbi:reverse transcriptase-like protein [Plakobranchus ocellatus]|uniref:Reverse transcriptase-like protein n=1 Tax=Plakobranchus ocellatus TaxID=259542 RepID=A0AAV3ZN46_9GAST|nr:reverse transcriptase-like protein [Plakobranchus ocellatus]